MKHTLMKRCAGSVVLFAFGILALPSAQANKITAQDAKTPPVHCLAVNPIDDPQFFVTQQYLDLLLRQPDPGGLAYWTAQITQCGSDLQCRNAQRIAVSRAFWESAEFHQLWANAALFNSSPPPEFSNDSFVELCYLFYFRRFPDPDGFALGLSNLNNCTADPNRNGNNGFQCYNDLIGAFINSTEYRMRFGPC